MNGTAHMAAGAAAGFITANSVQGDFSTTAVLVTIGGISGLIPDLDIDGKLSNKMTFSPKMIRTVAGVISILMMVYSFLEEQGREQWIGIGYGVGILLLSTMITQRRMLMFTGIGVTAAGWHLNEIWLLLLGLYIIVASLIPHRTYTHSILGFVFFGFIASNLESSLVLEGVFEAAMLGYASHLIGDMKLLPFNKRGVKLFLPLSSKEF
ncbi:metal-dependent hydrolase [Rossellomorea aquimaris]|uniref:metal-dependent hydrolase n=1 Tax=Rossellomorea aquimaris TaxID=189382 RepID=UPI001CD440C5|nr:metal-dependent hydrolase [Rossellomorea aquimaris]MCA1053665.1 metal-dependent hydrolase [Rossellomorea aquimaris]